MVDYPNMKSLAVQRDGSIAYLTLQGPGPGNLQGPDFFEELPKVCGILEEDDRVKVVVLRGAGEDFCLGLDIVAMSGVIGSVSSQSGGPAKPRTRLRKEILAMQQAIEAVHALSKPVVAAVHGRCFGGGIDLIAACDVRFASEDTRFSIREVKVAIVADLGGLQRLPGIIGQGHLRDLALSGRDFDALHAERIGLVSKVLPTYEELARFVSAYVDEISNNPPLTVAGTKAVLNRAEAEALEEGLDYVATWNAAFLASEDLAEAVAAVLEGRKPAYRGR
ncbi:crotonase/enoyl-CoA hydratase family protein [Nocardia nova]|uniref:crotonase/enoyl-CoA hydratase family protein n=1 Tax=Nocardia nova TaxID=37330 RepID=UPI001C48AC98|nr:crotonase/enoyl-CoA hydratase family protein [Nocardia nova]MBV7708172.1 crotonase/enoyl-CoA hydratase family protein [Nocardia nova]